jgi:transcriptional regulator with XRE-family HTH domain
MGTNEEVIKRITEIRKKNGLSINKLADKCGVNSANLSRSLAGKASLTDRVIYKIANALHVSVDWLENGIEPMFSPTVASTADVGAGITGSNVSQSISSDAALVRELELLKKMVADKDEEIKFLRAQLSTKISGSV